MDNVQVLDRLDNAVYHARHDHVSNSMLSDFLRSPEYFHGRYVARTIPGRKSAAMDFGSLFHDAVLLGIENAWIEIPDEALSSNGAKQGAAWKYFQEHYAGLNKPMLKKDESEALRNMVDAVWSHPVAARLLDREGAAIEQSIFWTDAESGLKLKARLDHRKAGIITDLKSTADVSRRGFASAMHEYRYSTQAVFYKEAARAATGEEHHFVFVAVEKEPPHRVRCYELDPTPDRALTKGYEDFRSGLARLAECYRTGVFAEPGWDQILTLDLPNWAYSNQWEYVDGDSTTAE